MRQIINHILATMVAVAMVFTASFAAQARDPFPVTPELIDSLNSKDATWPKDPAVPDLPPLSATDDPPVPVDNFLRSHFWDGLHPPKKKAPTPLTASVTTAKPLKIDVIWSMRSPYCYIMLPRLKWLQSNYNVDLTVRFVLPIAVRSTKGGSGKAGGVFGIWYKVQDEVWDVVRTAQFEGVPFKWATPDPIWQTFYPPFGKNFLMVHPPEKQPYIGWVVRLGAYAQIKGKSLEYASQVSHIIWSNEVEHWPAHVKERFNQIEGLDYDKAIEYIQKNPKKIDAIWLGNNKIQQQAGHGGVPLMIFQGEPFFGQDRFDQFFWRLRQSGLTMRKEPRPPFTSPPLRWPSE